MIHVCIFVFISVFRFAYLSSVLLFAATVDPLLLRDKSDHHLCDNCHLHDHHHNYNQIITLIIIPDNCYHPEYPCKHVERPLAPNGLHSVLSLMMCSSTFFINEENFRKANKSYVASSLCHRVEYWWFVKSGLRGNSTEVTFANSPTTIKEYLQIFPQH